MLSRTVTRLSSTLRVVVCLLALITFHCLTIGEAFAEIPPFKIYTTEEGLAHDNINRIVRDSRGFLWFCTAEGLSRFDGRWC